MIEAQTCMYAATLTGIPDMRDEEDKHLFRPDKLVIRYQVVDGEWKTQSVLLEGPIVTVELPRRLSKKRSHLYWSSVRVQLRSRGNWVFPRWVELLVERQRPKSEVTA